MSVTVDDIAVELGRATPDESTAAQWNLWLSDALLLIKARLVGTGANQVATLGDLDPETLDYVVRQAVVAQVKRPDDATQVDVRVDDGQVAKTYRSSAGRVTIRDEWWDLLSPTTSRSGAFSIRPSGCDTIHQPWCALAFGATYCSCAADIAGFPLYEYADDEVLP